jgi:hypothetical protein
VIPLGDLLAPGSARESATNADHESAHSASVVDIGRWNPRRPRDKSVSPGGGPDGTQPALFTPSGPEPHEPHEPHESRNSPGPREHGPHEHGPHEVLPVLGDERPITSADRPQTPTRGTSAARRKGRAQVPSWDEIVFGARPEPG